MKHLSHALYCKKVNFKLSNEADRACARVEAPQPSRALCMFYIQRFEGINTTARPVSVQLVHYIIDKDPGQHLMNTSR